MRRGAVPIRSLRSAGNAALVQALSEGRPDLSPAPVQRMPAESGRHRPAGLADHERSVFEPDTDSEAESDTEPEPSAAEHEPHLPDHPSLRPFRGMLRRARANGSPGPFTVTVKADAGAPWTSEEFRGQGEVGHVWLHVISPLNESISFGFYPGRGLDNAFAVAPGEVRCPDLHYGGPEEEKSAQVTTAAVVEGYQVAVANAGRPYHLARYNCASFAAQVWQAMTGQPLPRGFFVSNPASVASSLRSERRTRESYHGRQISEGMDAMLSGHYQVGHPV